MLGSMYSAVSGLSAHQTKMNIIGNNIANVNTYGFKSSRVTFSDVFYQTMKGASAPNGNGGGTNPTQMGYGSKINSIDVINTRAGSATTDRALDVYINGDGYLPVKNTDGVIKYTRVGVLSFDVAGNLVDGTGNMVLGLKLVGDDKNPELNPDGKTTVQKLVPINIPPSELDKLTGIAIGQNGEITGIKEGDPTVLPSANTGWIDGAPTIEATSTYNGPLTMTARIGFLPSAAYTGTGVLISSDADIDGNATSIDFDGTNYTFNYQDALGNSHTSTAAATTIDASTVPSKITFNILDKEGTQGATIKIPLHDTDASLGFAVAAPVAPATNVNVALGSATPSIFNLTAKTYDKSGAVVTITDTWDSSSATDSELTFGDITIGIDQTDFKDALDSGFTSVSVGNIGPGAGVPIKMAQISTVKFTNPDGLSQDGQGYFLASINSGEPVATVPGSGGTGNFRAGALEMSNVDLSKEFTEMIITQRGFQANTRMITVSDEMLSELISMKR